MLKKESRFVLIYLTILSTLILILAFEDRAATGEDLGHTKL